MSERQDLAHIPCLSGWFRVLCMDRNCVGVRTDSSKDLGIISEGGDV